MQERAEKRYTAAADIPVMNNPAGFSTGELAGPLRIRRWDECSIEERIERVREALLELESAVNYAGRTATKASNILSQHQHGGHGEILVPAGESPHLPGYFEHVLHRLR
jgi:hypothetical protein